MSDQILRAVHVTAAQAYPALEEHFLDAESSILASFMVFDLSTRLRSKRGRAIGATWFDLVHHTLARGVNISISISDVDPIGRPKMHRAAMRTRRMFLAAAGVSNHPGRLQLKVLRHPAQTGRLIRLAIWPYILKRLYGVSKWLNGLTKAERRATLRDMPGMAEALTLRRGRLWPRLFVLPALYPCLHHQKLAVFDEKRLYIGGLDLNERRFDTLDHNQDGDQTWHDVQLEVEGAGVAAAVAHLRGFHAHTAGTTAPAPEAPPFLRTLSTRRRINWAHFGPHHAVDELHKAHLDEIARAERLIYIETQYFRDRALSRALARRARSAPDLRVILVLPAAPDDVAFEGKRGFDARFGAYLQARALRRLTRAFGNRVLVTSPAQRRQAAGDGPDRLHGAPLIYVHSKVSLFDDRAAIVASANLNRRSLFWDTEAGVRLDAPKDVAALTGPLLRHWWPEGAIPQSETPRALYDRWRTAIWANARRAPSDRECLLLPHDIARAEAFGKPVPILPEEMV
ncbi:phospholipase (plasmid) [Pseudorhodobacter turbinis]|uniref:Phospholipase D n=1 Tax=Pseudorhodobacter turbinis TaxID=2500533 RepID=A0A4P8EJP5_9RHOB|nr:phospholipase D-like domain-containing protein [Pseudorhodobacter turbinis]QCO57199.1 phospholipase [Pseudorhodobacter turbinis]